MIPDLLEKTHDYWQQLDELEAAYQRDEMSPEEVHARVDELMHDLGRSRREAVRALWASAKHTVQQQQDLIVGLTCLAITAYAWWVVS